MRDYFCVSGRLTLMEYETVVVELIALGMQGVEEDESNSAFKRYKIYFYDKPVAEQAAKLLYNRIQLNDSLSVVSIADDDWNARWRESMEPAQLAPSWWVAPPWLAPSLSESGHWIKIEPKMAFGTGHHETTRLAASALINGNSTVSGKQVLDIGTGSGILCFVAMQLGALFCCGLDIDPNCRENLAENREMNGIGFAVSFFIGSTDALKSTMRFDCIVMNMIQTESAPILSTCRKMIKKTGFLIWSGILNNEKEEAVALAANVDFNLIDEQIENEWWCGVFNTTSYQDK